MGTATRSTLHTARHMEDRAALTKARSMLILLLATCKQTQTALEAAANHARREALQRLAFLWGEPLPATAPEPEPAPDYHHGLDE